MHGRYANIPENKDTESLFLRPMKFSELDCLHEKWTWNEFAGESRIFASEDVAHLDDAALEAEIATCPPMKGEPHTTVCLGDSGCTFVNFNFNTDDAERVSFDDETYPLDEFPNAGKELSKESCGQGIRCTI